MSLLAAAAGAPVAEVLADPRSAALAVPAPPALDASAGGADGLTLLAMVLVCAGVFTKNGDLAAAALFASVAAWTNRGPGFKLSSWLLSTGTALFMVVSLKAGGVAAVVAAAAGAGSK